MRRIRFTVIKNASANLVRGCATAVVAVALPHFLTRTLDHDRFAAWSLMLQMAAYASYLDFGLQTAVARYMARYTERGEEEERNRLASTALALLSLAAVVALVVMALVLWQMPHLFRGAPDSLLGEFRWAVAVLGFSTAILLPFSTFSGVLIGLHRNEYVALAVGGSRVLGAIGVILASQRTHSLVVLAACIVFANLLGSLLQVITVPVLLPGLRLSGRYVRRTMAAELVRYCGGLTIWNLSMFLVCGLDLTIVGYFDFGAVGVYSVAASLVTLFAGANSAACSALMTPVAALHAAGQIDRVRNLTLAATRLNTYLNVVATVGMFLFGPSLLRIWVGQTYARAAFPIVEVLMVANAIRLIGNPYASMLIAVDQQKHGVAQGLVEGVTNFGGSILGAIRFGAIGVAWGTLAGAIAVVLWVCALTLKWVKTVALSRWSFVKEGIVRPLICGSPLVIFAVILGNRPLTFLPALFLGLCALGSYLLIDRFGKLLPSFLRMRRAMVQPG